MFSIYSILNTRPTNSNNLTCLYHAIMIFINKISLKIKLIYRFRKLLSSFSSNYYYGSSHGKGKIFLRIKSFYKSYFSRRFPASLYTCSSVLAEITIIFIIPSIWIVLYTTLIPRFRNFIFRRFVRLFPVLFPKGFP